LEKEGDANYKWRLWVAAALSLIPTGITLMTSFASGDLSLLFRHGRGGEIVGETTGRLLTFPALFVLIAFIHNLFVGKMLR
jgi:hypothetical protein